MATITYNAVSSINCNFNIKGMGSVCQDMFGVINKDSMAPMVTSVPAPKLTIPKLVKLPLVIVKGNFRCLNKLDEDELEDFLRYLCRVTAGREKRSRYTRPIWWCDDVLPFSRQFARGGKLAYVIDKDKKMRIIIKTAYRYYSCKELLVLSSKFSEMHILSMDFKTLYDDTVVVFNKRYQNPLVRIPASNIKYDYNRQPKKIPKEVNLIEVITIDDESPKKKIPLDTESPNKDKVTVVSECPKSSVPVLTEVQKLAAVRPPHFRVNGSSLLNKTILNCNNGRLEKERPTAVCADKQEPEVTIVLTDSDDDQAESNVSVNETKQPESTPTRRQRKRLLNVNQITSPLKKRSSMFERLTNLERSGSVSYYPCITLSDYEEKENDSDDCQIISVYEPPTNNNLIQIKDIFSLSKENGASELEEINYRRKRRRRKSEQGDCELKGTEELIKENNDSNSLVELCKQSSEPEQPTIIEPPDQENFLAHFCLIRKDKYDKVQSYIQPFKKLRRLRLPLYHMPLDLLPALVARGVINASHLEHTIPEEVPERKIKRLKRSRIRYNLPAGIYLKPCSVVLRKVPNDSILNTCIKLNDCK